MRRGGGGGARAGGAAGGGSDLSGAGTPEVSVGSKRKAVYESLMSPAAKAARTGGDAGGAGERPAYDESEVVAQALLLYRWEFRANDGTYVQFDKEQCVEIETCWRKRQDVARVWGTNFPVGQHENLKCVIDFGDMTAGVMGSEWATAIRRWDIRETMGESWDHQVDDVSIVRVEPGSVDYALVASAFFDRRRADGRAARLSRETHCIVQVRRIQNRRQLGMFETERKSLVSKRTKEKVELTQTYAWHGSGKVRPDSIAAGKGFMMQVGAEGGWWRWPAARACVRACLAFLACTPCAVLAVGADWGWRGAVRQ